MPAHRPFLLVLALFAATCTPAHAGPITSVNDIRVDAVTDWAASFGPPGTGVAPGSYAELVGLPNTSVSVFGPAGYGFGRFDQGNGVTGNFAPGTPLLGWYYGGDGEPEWRLEFRDSTTTEYVPQSGFALQYQAAPLGPFTVELRVYGVPTDPIDLNGPFEPGPDGPLLGSHTYSGVSNDASDGSALWVGWRSDARDIGYFTLTFTNNPFNHGSAIGPLFVQGEPFSPASPVPAPAGIVLAGVAAAFGAVGSRFRRPPPAADRAP